MESLETQAKAQTLEEESTPNEESGDLGSSGQKAFPNYSEAYGKGVEDNAEGVDVVVAKTPHVATEICDVNNGISCVEGDISVAEVVSLHDHRSSGGMGVADVEGSFLMDEGVADETQVTGLPHENGNNAVIGDASVINENEVAMVSVGEELKEDDGSMLNGGNSARKIEVLGLNEDEENGVRNIWVDEEITENGDFQLNGSDSARKIEFSGNEISLVVEVHGSSDGVVQGSGSEVVEASCKESQVGQTSVFQEQAVLLPENGGKPGGKVKSKMEITKNDTVADEEMEEEAIDDQEHEFTVGDLVWGKIKSRPWWPGQIYHPSDASEIAAKCHRGGRLLVAFFGNGNFAWCYPSQLKPFRGNFNQMSRQSISTRFLNSVKEALGEIGRRAKLEMTCSCVPIEDRNALVRPLAVNAGIKEGVAVPESWVSELAVTRYEPVEILARLKYIAKDVSVISMLELTVLQSWLRSFCRANGYNQLPIYLEPKGITEPLENDGNVIPGMDDLHGQTEDPTLNFPEQDWLSLPIIPGFGQTLAEKWPGISEEKLYQRKRKRSMTELLAPASRKRKKNKVFDVGTYSDLAEDGSGRSKSSSLSKTQKKIKLSASPSSIEENKHSSVENNDIGSEGVSKTSSLSRERKKSKYLSPPYTILGRGIKSWISFEDSETKSPEMPKHSCVGDSIHRSARQFTRSHPIVKCNGKTIRKRPSKGLHEMSASLSEKPKEYSVNALEEGSVSVKKMLSEFQSAALDPMYLKENESSETIKGFFTKFRSSLYDTGSYRKMSNSNAADQQVGKINSLDTKPDSPGKNSHETCNQTSEGKSKEKKRKRKEEAAAFHSPESNSKVAAGSANVRTVKKGEANEEKDLHETEHPASGVIVELKKRERKKEAKGEKNGHKMDHPTSEGISEGKKGKKKRKAMSQNPESKSDLAAGTAIVKTNHGDEANGETSGAFLLLTFSPGVPLPSKEDLITIFGRFGALNEFETEVLKDSCCARVAYTRSSNAEAAFNSSEKNSPFGPAVVNYRLRYLSSTSKTSEYDKNSLESLPKPLQMEGGYSQANRSILPLPVGESPPLIFIKQNLEMMTSMLESSGEKLSPDMKANLEGGIKGLLKKVSTMVESPLSLKL